MSRSFPLVVLTFALPSFSPAITIFYGGEMNPASNFEPHYYGPGPQTQIFDDFVLSAPTRITGIFTDQFTNSSGNLHFNAEIRTGITPGSGGTIVWSTFEMLGTRTATGRSFQQIPEYRHRISGLSIDLSPGNYWFNILPWSPSNLPQSNGLNGIGPTVGNNLVYGNSIEYTWNWTPVNINVPMGVEGEPVPEPMSLIGLAIGACFFRRSSKSA